MFIDRLKQHNIADLIHDELTPHGFECIDVDWTPPSRTLVVYVDCKTGIGIEQCETVSNILVEMTKLDELIPCEFNLEVSSPGIERPLRTKEHFARAFSDGAEIEVKLVEKVENRRNGRGLITDFSNDLLTLKTAEGMWTFPRLSVQKATQKVDWDRINPDKEGV